VLDRETDMKILLADDDRDLLNVAGALLRSYGYKTVMALDATQVLPSAQREKPDLILLDIAMPGGKGTELLVRLKRSSLTAGIPVIVVSGSQDPKMPSLVAELGAEGFIPKPWLPESFVQDIWRLTPQLSW